MPFRCVRGLLGVLLVAAIAGCTTPPSPPLPSPSASPGAYACPPGDLLIETGPSDQALFEEQAVAYSTLCENQARLTVSSARDGGTASFLNGLVHIAAADTPLDEEQARQAEVRCLQHPAWHLPVATDPVALLHRVDGVPDLTLRPTTLARIFSGAITRWNDPAIAADNPEATLPNARIEVFSRGGRTGVTQTLGDYLNHAAPEAWPVGGTPAWRGAGQPRGSAAEVIEAIRTTPYAIGYVEMSALPRSVISPTPTPSPTPSPRPAVTATAAASPTASATATTRGPVEPRFVQLLEDRGPLALTPETAQQGVLGLQVPAEGNNLVVTPTATDGWPIIRVTYQIVCSAGQRADLGPLEQDWVDYLVADATQEAMATVGRPALGPAIRERVRAAADALS